MDEYIEPHPDRVVLLTIDTQNDFTLPGAPAEIDGTAEAVPQMARLVKAFRSENEPIIHVVRLYKGDGSNVDQCRRQAIEEGKKIVRPETPGAELVDELKPTGNIQLDSNRLLNGEFQELRSQEWVMYKPRWSAFYRTELTSFLDSRDVDTIVVCGCNFPNCPRTTIYEASERDYRIVCVSDAISGTYERGLEELEGIGVSVKRTRETIEWLTSS
jgi:nicotinamidase-related amidase